MCKLLKELGLKIDPDKKDKAKWKSVSKEDLTYAKSQFGAKGAQLEELTGKIHKLNDEQGKILDKALEENLKRRNNKWLKDRNNYKPLAKKLVENILKPVKDGLEIEAQKVLTDVAMTKVPLNATPTEITTAGVENARNAVKTALKDYDTRVEGDVTAARNLLPTALAAVDTAEKAAAARLLAQAKSDYEVAFDLIKANYRKADKIDDETRPLKLIKLAAPAKAYLTAYNARSNAVKAQEWVKAKDSLPALDKASTELIKVGDPLLKDKKAFDKEFTKVTDLEAAKNIAKKPPLTLVAGEVKVFREKFPLVNDAKNIGEFGEAKKALPALQVAITNLVEANKRILAEKKTFQEEMGKIADYETAKQLALAKSPAVTDKIAAFTLADKNVSTQVKKEDWAEAAKLVPALKTATEKLLEARNHSNTTMTPETKELFNKKMTALEPRTNKATTDGPTKFVTGLKGIVKGAVGKIKSAVSADDFASAEVLHTELLADLGKMESAITGYEEHLVKYDQAKKGEVKKALAVKLEPKKLRAERNKALKVTEDRIIHFADKGNVKKANDIVITWINEAKAWESAQAASDNLNKDAEPNEQVLKALAGLPGGGKVLDALMDGLPEGKPEKFIKEAIKIRYGIEVKRFVKKNPDSVADLQGLTPIGPDVPDKDLKKMYQLFGKVPLSNVKGKVTELIQFDEDGGGAAAGGKKIYMYCGRANDPNGSKQKFGTPGYVLPAGEEVEEDFQPINNDEIPYFDFAALHEVGHAVDEKEGIMTTQKRDKIAGWQSHKADAVGTIAAAHFKYDEKFVKDTLANANSEPPAVNPAPPKGTKQEDWDKARELVVSWCQSVRVGSSLWNNGALSKHVAIGGRVYQEAYAGQDWVSYELAARSKGITGYQFRSKLEWFAELYAAYFSGKLKKNHPYASWLKPLKKIA